VRSTAQPSTRALSTARISTQVRSRGRLATGHDLDGAQYMGIHRASMRLYGMVRGGGRCGSWAVCLAAHAGCLANPDAAIGSNTAALSALTGESELVTWTCTDSPCPWGDSLGNPAIAWPAEADPVAARLGYTASPAAYLPADQANGLIVAIDSGTASLYAGRPSDDSHRWIATLAPGDRYQVAGLAPGEVLSVQADAPFTYQVQPGDPGDPPPAPAGDAIQAIQAFWVCDIPECSGDPWTGAVIAWPAWAAYQSNARSYDQSRSVFDADGAPLYPYMGAWADGCEVTAVSGPVLIIEWQRGTDAWRETPLASGQSHTIHLVAPEDGAMIETYDGVPGFSVSLRSCTPQPLPE
jgi:hypothetical protein